MWDQAEGNMLEMWESPQPCLSGRKVLLWSWGVFPFQDGLGNTEGLLAPTEVSWLSHLGTAGLALQAGTLSSMPAFG